MLVEAKSYNSYLKDVFHKVRQKQIKKMQCTEHVLNITHAVCSPWDLEGYVQMCKIPLKQQPVLFKT